MKKVDLKTIVRQLSEIANTPNSRLLSSFDDNVLGQEDFSDPALLPLQAPWFERFIMHPQINFWVTEGINFHFLCTESGYPQLDGGIVDRICNLCVQILQENWEVGDEGVAAFRKFWDSVLALYGNCKRSSLVSLKSQPRLLDFITANMKHAAEESRERLAGSIADFVPLNESYERIRQEYQKKIKEHYRVGFIYLLGDYKFNDFYIPPTLCYDYRRGSSLSNILSQKLAWQNIFERNRIIYVIGAPGTGKSLFLQNILNNYPDLDFYSSRDYLVIYCDLKTYYTNGESNKKSIPAFLQESIINTIGMDKQDISTDFISYNLRLGRCLVLLDALDEVPKNKRQALHKKAVTYFKTAHPNNRICITSRDRGFFPQEEITVLKIPALSPEDVSDYIDRMIKLKKFKGQDKDRFLQQAQALIDKHFLNSFLVLSLLVNIYKAEKELPENKINLYKKCFEYIAKKREEENTKVNYDWKAIAPIMKDSTFISLSVLAAPNNAEIGRETIEEMLLDLYKNKYNDEAETEHAIREFLEFCSARTELFVLSNSTIDDRFRFFHRSFFEYFYSRYIAQNPSVEKMYQLMTQFDVDSEVFELTVALIKEENERKYQQLIDYIFTQIKAEFLDPQPKYTAFSILTLSMQVVDDIQYLREYFNIVVDHPGLMASKDIQGINQSLIELGICPIIAGSDSESKRFCQAYYYQYIISVIDMLSLYMKANVSPISILDDIHPGQEFVSPIEAHTSGARKVYHFVKYPFYIHAYPPKEAEALQEDVLSWDSTQINKFLSKTSNSKIRRKRRATFKEFMKLDKAHRESLWRHLTGRSLPESGDTN